MTKLKTLFIICLTALTVNGCAVPTTKIGDIQAANAGLMMVTPEHVIVELPDIKSMRCDRTTNLCSMTKEDADKVLNVITRQADVITELNRTIDALTKGHNKMVDSLTHCEYANARQNETIMHMERQGAWKDGVSVAKQVAISGVCALLLAN